VQVVETTTLLPLPPRLLAAIAIDHAFAADFGMVAEPEPGERTSVRVYLGETHDIWLIRWGIDSGTALHDHGGSAGALYVARGQLVERRPNPTGVGRPLRREMHTFDHRPMASSHVHEVANESNRVAASIHVYSPPLETMQHYELTNESAPRAMHRETIS
jgi:hypothetical protein